MAKAKKAKKAKSKAKRKADPCQALRDRIVIVQQQIRDIREALSDPDIPESIKRRLRTLLTGLQAILRLLREELRKCEARNK